MIKRDIRARDQPRVLGRAWRPTSCFSMVQFKRGEGEGGGGGGRGDMEDLYISFSPPHDLPLSLPSVEIL